MANPLGQSNFTNSLMAFGLIRSFLPKTDQESFAICCKTTRNLDIANRALATIMSLKIFSPNNPSRYLTLDNFYAPGTLERREIIEAESKRLDELREGVDKTLEKVLPINVAAYSSLRWKIRLTAIMAKENCLGNCGELAFLIYEWMEEFFPKIPCDIGCIYIPKTKPEINHGYAVIGDLNSHNAVICDPWTIRAYPCTPLLKRRFLFTLSRDHEGNLIKNYCNPSMHIEYYLIKHAHEIDEKNKAKSNQQASRPNNGG